MRNRNGLYNGYMLFEYVLGHAERSKGHIRQSVDKVPHDAVPLVPCNDTRRKQTEPEYKSDHVRAAMQRVCVCVGMCVCISSIPTGSNVQKDIVHTLARTFIVNREIIHNDIDFPLPAWYELIFEHVSV